MFFTFAGGTSAFTPVDITGLNGWVESSDPANVVLFGTDLDLWTDLSTNGWDILEIARPPYDTTTGINGNNAIGPFNGTSEYLTSGEWDAIGVGLDQPVTVAGVFKAESTAAAQTIFSWYFLGGTDAQMWFGIDSSGNWEIQRIDNSGNTKSVTGGAATTDPVFFVWTMSGTETNLYINGLQKITDGDLDTPSSISPNAVGLGIRRPNSVDTALFTGRFGEFVLYDKELSGSEVAQLENYFSSKWSIAKDAPSATTAPAVTGNTGIGEVLTTDDGTWDTQNLTYSYQWQRDGVDIPGETSSTYTTVVADHNTDVRCVVTASHSGSPDGTANSNAISVAGAVPSNSVAPAVTGDTGIGDTLTTTDGTWTGDPTPTYTYQWQRDTVNIAGATNNTYTTVSADDGADVRCVVTATNALGSDTANSNAVSITDDVIGNLSPTAWFKAGTGITDNGTNISDWADESANSNDATQATSGNRPLVGTQNSLTVLDCVPEDMIHPPNTIGLNGATEGTIIFAAKLDASIGAFDAPIAFGGGSGPRLETASNTGRSLQAQGSLGIQTNSGNVFVSPVLGSWAVYTIEWDAAGFTTYIDGVQDTTRSSASNTFSASTTDTYGIGGTADNNRGALCEIGEVVYFVGSKLSSSDRSAAESDISSRLGF